MAEALSQRLRIGRGEALRRIGDARMLASRTALTGEILAPLLSAVAEGVARGAVGAEHVRIIGSSSIIFRRAWMWVRAKQPKPISPTSRAVSLRSSCRPRRTG